MQRSLRCQRSQRRSKRKMGRREKGIIVFPIERRNEFTSAPSFDTKFSRVEVVFLLSCHFFFFSFFFFSFFHAIFRASVSPRCLAHCTAFYHHRRFPLLRLLCRFVSAFAASFRDELIKPDRSYRPEILTRGSRRPERR